MKVFERIIEKGAGAKVKLDEGQFWFKNKRYHRCYFHSQAASSNTCMSKN